MVSGSCLCGKVKFEVSTPLGALHYCHCSLCRKAHGSAFSAFTMTERAGFRYTAGESDVREFASSPPIKRGFCMNCGSNLTFTFEGMADKIWVSAGALDGNPPLKAEGHIFVGSKAPWYEIADKLHQDPEYPSF